MAGDDGTQPYATVECQHFHKLVHFHDANSAAAISMAFYIEWGNQVVKYELHFTFPSEDDVDVFVYHWPATAPRGVVQIAHGAAEHAARYGRLAEQLVRSGYTVFANDHRGHGRTAEPEGLG